MSDLHVNDHGEGPPVLLIHGTGTSSDVFADLPDDFCNRRVISYDRRGWGQSHSLGDYSRTSIAEQAIEAAGIIRSLAIASIEVIGVGLGGVIAMEMAAAEPDLVNSATAIEPPVFGLLPAATAGLSRDVELIREGSEDGDPRPAYELFLGGELTTLGAGAERFESVADRGPESAHTLLVEIPAVPAWPIDRERINEVMTTIKVLTIASTPPVLMEAANQLAVRLEHGERIFDAASPFIPAV